MQSEGRTFHEGEQLASGEKLGRHIGAQTDSDIAVRILRNDPWTLVSVFDIMTDEVFSAFRQHSIHSRCNIQPLAACTNPICGQSATLRRLLARVVPSEELPVRFRRDEMIISVAERDAHSLSPCPADGPLCPYAVCRAVALYCTACLVLHRATLFFSAAFPVRC